MEDFDLALPFPLVSWPVLVSVADPIKAPTRAKLVKLRTKLALGPGVRVRRHKPDGTLAGSDTVYSSATRLGVRLVFAGDLGNGHSLIRSGIEIERDYENAIQSFLSIHPLNDLPQADFLGDLLNDTARALAERPSVNWSSIFSAVGVIDSDETAPSDPDVISGWRRAVIPNPPQVPDLSNLFVEHLRRFRIPREAIANSDVHPGDLVWFEKRPTNTGYLVILERALALHAANSAALKPLSFAQWLTDTPTPGNDVTDLHAVLDQELTDSELADFVSAARATGAPRYPIDLA